MDKYANETGRLKGSERRRFTRVRQCQDGSCLGGMTFDTRLRGCGAQVRIGRSVAARYRCAHTPVVSMIPKRFCGMLHKVRGGTLYAIGWRC